MGAEETAVPAVTEQAPSTPETAPDQAATTEPSQTVDSFTKYDPSSLPEELKGLWDETYKSMQGDYTRKTQEIADARSKAEALDALLSNEEFQSFLNRSDASPEQPAAPASEAELAALIQTDPAAAVRQIAEQVRAEMEGTISPVLQDFQARRESEAASKAESVYAELVGKYPDLPEYEDQVAERVAKGYDVEEAIKAIRYDRAYQHGVDTGAQAAAKRDSAAQPTSRPATATHSGPANSWDEAVERARRVTSK